MDTPIIDLDGVRKAYDTPTGGVTVLDGARLTVAAGEIVAIVGRSGSGKSTLLHVLTSIDRADSGRVEVAGTDIARLDERDAARWRARSVGIVFQFFQLMPTLTLLENVLLPMELDGRRAAGARVDRARQLLDRVGLGEAAARLPAETSGGQQQRAALARALANDPPLLVADEPTGNLDPASTVALLDVLEAEAAAGRTIVLVTHDAEVAGRADRRLRLEAGRLAEVGA
jgi:putative ABC transport system ATP-binding protein